MTPDLKPNPAVDAWVNVPGTALMVPPLHWWIRLPETRVWVGERVTPGSPWLYFGSVN